jgi:vacuolar iron transporter family protein
MPELSRACGVSPGDGSSLPPGPPVDGEVAERHQWASSVQSGAARAAVLGINDGLVTNISLILGVVGATEMPGVVQLAGLASLVAGACSMAVGEYVSVRAQVALLERLLVEERQAIRANPERERALLQDTMQRHGFHEATARGNQGTRRRS